MYFGSSVLVTGANRGIGLGFVKQFADLPRPPKHIFATCRNPQLATELNALAERNPTVHVIKLDVTKEDEIKEVYSAVTTLAGNDGLNLLINNAGIGGRADLYGVTYKGMMDSYATNTVGPTLMAKTFAPILKQTAAACSDRSVGCSRGAIINISSSLASITDTSSYYALAYRTSKAALNMITKCSAIQLAPDNVIVASILPGWVKTDLGGPNAEIEVEESVQDMFNVMSTLDAEGTGKYYDRRDGRFDTGIQGIGLLDCKTR